jgi:hypothetical protein
MLSLLVIGQKVFATGEGADILKECTKANLAECLLAIDLLHSFVGEIQMTSDWEGLEFAKQLAATLKTRAKSIRCQKPELLSQAIGRYVAQQNHYTHDQQLVVLEGMGDAIWWHQDVLKPRHSIPPTKIRGSSRAEELSIVYNAVHNEVAAYLTRNDLEGLKQEETLIRAALPQIQAGLRLGQSQFEIMLHNRKLLVSADVLSNYLRWQHSLVATLTERFMSQPKGTPIVLLGEIFQLLDQHVDAFTLWGKTQRSIVEELLGLSPQNLLQRLHEAGVIAPKVDASPEMNPEPKVLKSVDKSSLDLFLEGLPMSRGGAKEVAVGLGSQLILKGNHYLLLNTSMLKDRADEPDYGMSSELHRWEALNRMRDQHPEGCFFPAFDNTAAAQGVSEIALPPGDWVSLWFCIQELNRKGISPIQRNHFADVISDQLLCLLTGLCSPPVQACLHKNGKIARLGALHADAILIRLHNTRNFWKIRKPELVLWSLGPLVEELAQPSVRTYLHWWRTQRADFPLPQYWDGFPHGFFDYYGRSILAIVMAIAGPENLHVAANIRLRRLLRWGTLGEHTYAQVRELAYPGFAQRIKNTILELFGTISWTSNETDLP